MARQIPRAGALGTEPAGLIGRPVSKSAQEGSGWRGQLRADSFWFTLTSQGALAAVPGRGIASTTTAGRNCPCREMHMFGYLKSLVATVAVLSVVACIDQPPSSPLPPGGPVLAQGPAPQAAAEAQINALINALYGPTSRGAAHRDFARIKAHVAANRTDDAEQSILAFVQSALAAFANDELQDPNGDSPPTIADALRDLINTVAQFGGMAPPIPVVTGQAIAAGSDHACVLTNTGSAYCWGSNQQSQLGASTASTCTTISCSRVPVAVSGGHTFQTIDAGGNATCGIVLGGTVRCWGAGNTGQLGNGSTANSATPVAASISPLTSVSVGNSHACALAPGGAAWCWGSNANNELGAPSAGSCPGPCSATPLAVTGGFVFSAITTGVRHSCGLTGAGAAFCWGGTDGVGLLGNGTLAGLAPAPTPVSGGLTFKDLVSDGLAACALTTGGQAYCWGTNTVGQIGDGTTLSRTVPTPVSGGHTFARLATTAGQNSFLSHMCGITTAGAAYCWGSNASGQLGNSTDTMCNFGVPVLCGLIPIPVSGGHTWRELAVGQHFTCGITTSKAIYCWGSNETGQLGDGTLIINSPVPRLVAGSLSPP